MLPAWIKQQNYLIMKVRFRVKTCALYQIRINILFYSIRMIRMRRNYLRKNVFLPIKTKLENFS